MKNEIAIPEEIITNKIYLIREQKVMLDEDLAELYKVETKQLKRQVRRNMERFPEDFMFKLSKNEIEILRSQTAIKVNIQIIRVFTKLRQMFTDNLSIKLEIEEIKKNLSNQIKNIELVFSYLDELLEKKENEIPRTKIGYKKN